MAEFDRSTWEDNAAERNDAEWPKPEGPTWSKPCQKCGEIVDRYRGESDVTCGCGASYNAFGQRLVDDWRRNPSNYDDEISDLDGYEIAHANDN